MINLKKKELKIKKTHEFRSNILFIKNTKEHNPEKIIQTKNIKYKEHKKIKLRKIINEYCTKQNQSTYIHKPNPEYQTQRTQENQT